MNSLTKVSDFSENEDKSDTAGNLKKRRKSRNDDVKLLIEAINESNSKNDESEKMELKVRLEEAKARQMEAENQSKQIEQMLTMQ